METQTTKKFQPPSVYYTHLILYVCGFGLALGLLVFDIFIDEEVLLTHIRESEISGHAGQMRDAIIVKLIAHYLGKPGLMAIPITALLGFSIALYYKVYELVRYYRKNRLYVNGLVNNLDDDNPPPNFFKHVYLSLTLKREEKSPKMKLNKKDVEKLKHDKLYRRLYGERGNRDSGSRTNIYVKTMGVKPILKNENIVE
ncbi:hypothetical protein [Natronoflexus pectinivorans]|uniref:Uncharacterized protein n=1 Tax=Natronoflexus pectinivorans TaxID=682526 RepID=A0A4R2GJ88_9BACT|nr:hypothetical protein [Natronoflexus pectinivorans]TCO08789.1 hypothetical protein EV194_104100 [Natronoflexus pectinivorans]